MGLVVISGSSSWSLLYFLYSPLLLLARVPRSDKNQGVKMSEPGTSGQGESRKEPESLIQMLDAKCEERFERIESLIANMARSVVKRKDREHDSSEDESHDAASGRGHSAAKRAD